MCEHDILKDNNDVSRNPTSTVIFSDEILSIGYFLGFFQKINLILVSNITYIYIKYVFLS